jgi:uncharacterized protein YndB with AHSA1/START domain
MFKKIVIGLVVIVAVILAIAATKPSSFHVERSTSIAAPPEKVMEYITDFRKWGAWSPWEKLDPALNRTFSGPPSGKGSIYEWSGNSSVGSGRMEITSAEPVRTVIDLQFKTPMETRNVATFALAPGGANTNVVWSMDGPMPFMSKVMSVFVSMDSLIGKDFETGLANLKAEAEKS